MTTSTARKRILTWRVLWALALLLFFWLAVTNVVYEITSPSWLSWHVLLRKSYSVVAFAVVGFLSARARGDQRSASWLVIGAFVAAYSAVIEVSQQFVGAHESLAQQALDVALGFAGGALGAGAANASARATKSS